MGNLIIKKRKIVFVLDSSLISQYADLNASIETGGILFGFKVKDKEEYVITECTFPQEKDIATAFSFQRLDDKHFVILKEKWLADNTTFYFGDWHFHPTETAVPSWQDKMSFYDLCVQAKTSSKYMVNIITAKNEMYIAIFNRKKKKLFCQFKYLFKGEILYEI